MNEAQYPTFYHFAWQCSRRHDSWAAATGSEASVPTVSERKFQKQQIYYWGSDGLGLISLPPKNMMASISQNAESQIPPPKKKKKEKEKKGKKVVLIGPMMVIKTQPKHSENKCVSCTAG